MIMNPKDPLWRSCFSVKDLDEIVAHSNSHNELDRPLPTNINELLSKLNKKVSLANHLFPLLILVKLYIEYISKYLRRV